MKIFTAPGPTVLIIFLLIIFLAIHGLLTHQWAECLQISWIKLNLMRFSTYFATSNGLNAFKFMKYNNNKVWCGQMIKTSNGGRLSHKKSYLALVK